MTWVNDTIRDFGISIGLPELMLNERGILDLDLPNEARLRIAHLAHLPVPEVVLSRSETIFYPTSAMLTELLKLNDFRNSSEWPIQTAISDHELCISVRIPERSFVVNAMEQAFSSLQNMHVNIR
jgi:type III secretion system chaperone SycN